MKRLRIQPVVLAAALMATTTVVGCAGVSAGVRPMGPATAQEVGGAVVTFAPNCDAETCRGFYLVVDNRAPTPIEIDWARMQFLVDGTARGSFLGNGETVPKTAVMKLAPTVVAAGEQFQTVLFPIATSSFDEEDGWSTRDLPIGRVGGVLGFRLPPGPRMATFQYDIAGRAKTTGRR